MNYDRFDVKLADFLKDYINSEPQMIGGRRFITKQAGRYLAEMDGCDTVEGEAHFLNLVQRFTKV